MRLLFLAPQPPVPQMGGGSLRMFQMVRYLGRRVELDLVGPSLDGAEEATALLKTSCRDIAFVRPSLSGSIRRFPRLGPYERDPALAAAVSRRLAEGHYDAIQVEKPAMLPYVPGDSRVPLILDLWAFGLVGPIRALRQEAGLKRRARNFLRLVRFAAFDAFCWPATHCLLVVSETDHARCQTSRPDRRVVVVPNGVDCEAIQPAAAAAAGSPVLLFSGDMSFAPNVEAAVLLCRDLFPVIRRARPEVELRIVGRQPDGRVLECRGPGIVVTGEVPEMVPHLQRATVYVAPHFMGAGTRTKLLEAMAAGLPIVTTTIGIEGIAARHGHEVLVGDTREALVGAILQLLAAPAERRRIGHAARRLAEERYDWPRCLASLDEVYLGFDRREAAAC
jgi:glycosyltransferase involved in cell wall biosynthesis